MLSEADPEGCAACSARTYPQNLYRNGLMYPSYTAAAYSNIFKLADRYKSNMAGMLTWAFEFEDQPYFDGFRTLATNGVDKPVLNFFRMAGMMKGDRVKVESTGGLGLDKILRRGRARCRRCRRHGDARRSRDLGAGVELPRRRTAGAAAAAVHVALNGIAKDRARVCWCSTTASTTTTATRTPCGSRWARRNSRRRSSTRSLEAAGQLQLLTSPEWRQPKDGKLALAFTLPRHAVSLLRLTW